ncbi:hypothetical protein M5K25_014570 [Dendrobium thyrsiflorum]|uniref:Uncharacterized protein n=1 Tax=Dendrobium thyrsiflorum TaxID=117978 RepID=A0ABD0UNM2_DENTH
MTNPFQEHHPASFVETNRGHHCGRDHQSLSNIRVAAPPYRSSSSLDGRPSIGSSFGSVSYDSPLGPTPSHPSQPLASPNLDPASVILIEKCIRKKRSPEPETECIHFVDANDITDDEDFFEDETEPLDLDILVHPDPNFIKDIPLDKVCLDGINLISKEADLTLNTLKLSSEDSDFLVSPNETTPNNSNLILNNSDVDNLELEVSQLDLLPELDIDLIDPKSIELRVITKYDPIENTNMSSEDSNLNQKDSEPNWNNQHSLVLLESCPLDLHLAECVFPDLAYLIIPCTDFNVRESISPYLPIATLTVVPAFVLETLPHLLSPILASDYPIVVISHDPPSYHIPDYYIMPSISSSFPIKDHLSPSWMPLLDYPAAAGRLSMTIAETSYRNALVAKNVFIAPPTPVPLNMETLCPLLL